jgi:hypothetical protein
MITDEFYSMEELATFFGSTSHKIGRLLKTLGYRASDGTPTPKAKDAGLVKRRYGKYSPDKYIWAWHPKNTAAILQQAGLTLLPGSRSGLVS